MDGLMARGGWIEGRKRIVKIIIKITGGCENVVDISVLRKNKIVDFQIAILLTVKIKIVHCSFVIVAD